MESRVLTVTWAKGPLECVKRRKLQLGDQDRQAQVMFYEIVHPADCSSAWTFRSSSSSTRPDDRGSWSWPQKPALELGWGRPIEDSLSSPVTSWWASDPWCFPQPRTNLILRPDRKCSFDVRGSSFCAFDGWSTTVVLEEEFLLLPQHFGHSTSRVSIDQSTLSDTSLYLRSTPKMAIDQLAAVRGARVVRSHTTYLQSRSACYWDALQHIDTFVSDPDQSGSCAASRSTSLMLLKGGSWVGRWTPDAWSASVADTWTGTARAPGCWASMATGASPAAASDGASIVVARRWRTRWAPSVIGATQNWTLGIPALEFRDGNEDGWGSGSSYSAATIDKRCCVHRRPWHRRSCSATSLPLILALMAPWSDENASRSRSRSGSGSSSGGDDGGGSKVIVIVIGGRSRSGIRWSLWSQ